MGLTARQQREFDKAQSVGKSYKAVVKSQKKAAKKRQVVKTRTGKVYDAKGLVAKTKRRLYELYHGKKAYLKKKK